MHRGLRLATLAAILLLASRADAQYSVGSGGTGCSSPIHFADLPTTPDLFTQCGVDNCNTSACSGGGGTTKEVLWWNGASWVVMGSGGGGGGGTECSTSPCDLDPATKLNGQDLCLQDGTNCPAAGIGDMTKAVYDVANNGKVDVADAADALSANGANCTGNNFALGVTAAGVSECAQPAFSNLSGSATDAQVPDNITVTLAATATALAANGSNCSAGQYARGVDASGAAENCTADDDTPDNDGEVPDAITVDGGTVQNSTVILKGSTTPTPTAEGSCEWDTDNNNIVCGDGAAQARFYDGPHAGAASDGGAATTATALAANGANCSAGSFPLGVDASGAVESCSTSISGNAATATALAANGANCSGNNFALGVDASGVGECAQPAFSNLSGSATDAQIPNTITIDLATAATALAANGANCSSGTYPLGVDASGAAESCGSNINGNAGTATALAANGANCTAGSYPLGVDASGAAESCTAAPTAANPSGSIGAATATNGSASTYMRSDGVPACTVATGSVPGCLAAADWTTFNAKVGPSRAINTTSPLAGGGDLSTDRTLTIANAAADGATKGAASFTAADFDSSSGNISLDYTNGQAASGSLKGFLSSTDWTTFNNKVGTSRTLTAAAGLSGGGDLSADRTFATDSTEPAFLASLSLSSCGAGTSGEFGITSAALLNWCDYGGTPARRFAASGNIVGEATSIADSTSTIGTDSGTATNGSSPDFNILGGTSISTSASGKTVTINYTAAGLSIARALYVLTDGNDANNCTISSPCLTPQRCVNRSTEVSPATTVSNPVTCILGAGIFDATDLHFYNTDSTSSHYLQPAQGVTIAGQGRLTTIISPITASITNCQIDLTGAQSVHFRDFDVNNYLSNKPTVCSRGGANNIDWQNVGITAIGSVPVYQKRGLGNDTDEWRTVTTFNSTPGAKGRHLTFEEGSNASGASFCSVLSGLPYGACLVNADCGGQCDVTSADAGKYCTQNSDCAATAKCNTTICGYASTDFLVRDSLIQGGTTSSVSERPWTCQGGQTSNKTGTVTTDATATCTASVCSTIGGASTLACTNNDDCRRYVIGSGTTFTSDAVLGQLLTIDPTSSPFTSTVQKITSNTVLQLGAVATSKSAKNYRMSNDGWICDTNADCSTSGVCTQATGGRTNDKFEYTIFHTSGTKTAGSGGECHTAAGNTKRPPVACSTNSDCSGGESCYNEAWRASGSGNDWDFDHTIFVDQDSTNGPTYNITSANSAVNYLGTTSFNTARKQALSSGTIIAKDDGFFRGLKLFKYPTCSTNADCPTDASCTSGQCAPNPIDEASCYWSDVENQLLCNNGSSTQELIGVLESGCVTGQTATISSGGDWSCGALALGTSTVSGTLPASRGGTNQDWSASSGRPKVASGTWSLAPIALASEVSGLLPTANGGLGVDLSASSGKGALVNTGAGSVTDVEFVGSSNNTVLRQSAAGTLSFSNLAIADITSGDLSGNGSKLATATGTLTSGNYAKFDANGNVADSTKAVQSGIAQAVISLHFYHTGNAFTTSAVCIPIGDSAQSGTCSVIFNIASQDMTCTTLRVKQNANSPTNTKETYKFRKGDSDTGALTCDVASGTATCSQTGGSLSFSAGDEIDLSYICDQTGGGTCTGSFTNAIAVACYATAAS